MNPGQPQQGAQAQPGAAPAQPGERPSPRQIHREKVFADLAPEGALEAMLVGRVASYLWRLRRVEACAVWDLRRAEACDPDDIDIDLDGLIRYEAHLGRQLHQAVARLERLQQ